MAEKLKITLVKSTIGAVPKNRKTVEALGLIKLKHSVKQTEKEYSKSTRLKYSHIN